MQVMLSSLHVESLHCSRNHLGGLGWIAGDHILSVLLILSPSFSNLQSCFLNFIFLQSTLEPFWVYPLLSLMVTLVGMWDPCSFHRQIEIISLINCPHFHSLHCTLLPLAPPGLGSSPGSSRISSPVVPSAMGLESSAGSKGRLHTGPLAVLAPCLAWLFPWG